MICVLKWCGATAGIRDLMRNEPTENASNFTLPGGFNFKFSEFLEWLG
jgi:hypothetical protein